MDSLLDEVQYVIDGDWKECVGDRVKLTEEQQANIQKDHEYLMQMKAMDEEIRQKRKEKGLEKSKLEITPVVPVSGLVFARLHMYARELETALEMWCPTSPNESFYFFPCLFFE